MLPSVAVVGGDRRGRRSPAQGPAGTGLSVPEHQIPGLRAQRRQTTMASSKASRCPSRCCAPEAFAGIDLVFISAPASVSREFAPIAAKAGAIVVDKSSAWRMDPEVPLVVPEVNPERSDTYARGIVANPNCSTIQMVVALKPLHDLAGLHRVVVATYQASSGGGGKALDELDSQVRALGRGETVPTPRVHAAHLAGNVLPHDWKAGPDGYTEEETKMVLETRKILGLPELRVSPTTVRVPVRVGHSEALNLEFDRPISVEQARTALRQAPGVVLLDDLARGEVPLPSTAEGRDEVFVGRVRLDPSVPHGLNIWVVADKSAQGAQLTIAVQVAELLIRGGAAGMMTWRAVADPLYPCPTWGWH